MAPIALLLTILAACALPDLLPPVLGLAEHAPDLWVALTAYLALRARGYQSVGWAIALGLVRDVLSLDPLGTHAFVLGTTAWLFAEGARSRGRVGGLLRLGWTFVAALAAGWLYLLRLLPLGGGAVTWGAAVAAVATAAWTAALGAFLFPLFDRSCAFDDLCGRPPGYAS